VGPDIFQAPTLKESPLRTRINEDIFFTADRIDFLPHLKHALWYAGVDFFFRVMTDIDLMDAWLSKDKQHRKASEDEVLTGTSGTAWSSLRDAVEDPTLLILFLGVATHSNRALPNIVQEAAKIRGHAGKTTWIVTPRSHPLQEGFNNAWSDEGEAFFSQVFKMMSLGKNDMSLQTNQTQSTSNSRKVPTQQTNQTATGFLGSYLPQQPKK
jgi:hypothetical protein